MEKIRLLRVTTVPISLQYLLGGQLTFMQKQGFEVLAVSADGPELAALHHEGIPHRIIPFTRSITPLKDFICLVRLVLLIQNFRPDIVHTHTPKAGLLGMLAAWICRVPLRMHTVAGLPLMEASGFRRWLLFQTERVTYACATSVHPNSKGLSNYIMKEFRIQPNSHDGSKFKIIGNGSSNGIDLSYFQKSDALVSQANEIRNQYRITHDDFVYCFVGRVVKDKGIVELVTAFIEIASSENNVWLFLIGHFENELDPLPKEITNDILNHPKIIHTGFQKDVRPWILASDVIVLPSYREGFPNVVLQAGALEKPCIVSDINGCNEIIEENKTGLLIQPKDAESLRTAMMRLLQNRDVGINMGVEARKFIAAHFDQSYIWNELLKEYHDQLNRVSQAN